MPATPTEYVDWLKNAAHLDFGRSIILNESVTHAITSHASITLFMAVYGFVVTVIGGLVLGAAAALRRGTGVDRGAVGLDGEWTGSESPRHGSVP